MTSKTTSNLGKNSMTRQIQRNNDLIKGNMKMNAELIEAISQLSNAVAGIGNATAEISSSDSTSEKATLPVHLYMLLDRSGSMSGWQNDVIGGFNSFIKEQQSEKDECSVTLVQFDGQDPYEKILDAEKLESVQELDASVYSPRGNTPLLDALGRLIKSAEKRSTKTPEDVLVWVFTDGLENASQEFTSTQIKELVEEKEKEGWTGTTLRYRRHQCRCYSCALPWLGWLARCTLDCQPLFSSAAFGGWRRLRRRCCRC